MPKKRFVFCLILLVFFGIARAADISDITYPVPELGNCGSREECGVYCNEPENIMTCLDFAAGHALIPQEEVDRIKNELQKLNKFGLTEGPGGCRSDSECRAYCDQLDHAEECMNFAESHGLMPATILRQAKKIAQSEAQGISSPGGCTTKAECETYCGNDAHLEECVAFGVAVGFISEEEAAVIRGIGTMKGPGGCTSKKTCDAYCDNPNHFEECMEFAVAHDLMDEEEAEMAKKIGPAGGPGGCKNKNECEAYCNDSAHMEECLAFAEAHGLVSRGEAGRIRRMSEMERMGPLTGPGGCDSKDECNAYCQKPANMEECMKFAKEHGFMDDEEIRRAERLLPLMTEMAGPGGCRSPYECDLYCSDPDHMRECINFARAHNIMHEDELRKAEMFMREDFVGPGSCMGRYECDMYCMKPANQEECMEFGRKMGLVGEREEMMLREMEIMRGMPIEGFVGPGGCRSEQECFEFCFKPESFSICGRFGDMPPSDMTTTPVMRPDTMIGPGGCMSEAECKQYCSDPAHAMECGYAFAGVCGDGRCEPGEYCPQDCEMHIPMPGMGEGMGCGMIMERNKCEENGCVFCEDDPYPCYGQGHICRHFEPVHGGYCGDNICEVGEYCPPDCMTMPETPPDDYRPGMGGEPCGFSMCAPSEWCAAPFDGWCCPFGFILCPDGRCEKLYEYCKIGVDPGSYCGDGRCDYGEYCPMDCMHMDCGMITDPNKCKVEGCKWCEGGMYSCFPLEHICMTGPTGWCGDGHCEPGEYCPIDCEAGMDCGMYMNKEKCLANNCLFCEGEPYPCYPMGHTCGSQSCGSAICTADEWCANPTNGWCCPAGTIVCPDGACVWLASECDVTGCNNNGVCDQNETNESCPNDCSALECPSCYCGNDICETDESISSCPEDCGAGDYGGTCGYSFEPGGGTLNLEIPVGSTEEIVFEVKQITLSCTNDDVLLELVDGIGTPVPWCVPDTPNISFSGIDTKTVHVSCTPTAADIGYHSSILLRTDSAANRANGMDHPYNSTFFMVSVIEETAVSCPVNSYTTDAGACNYEVCPHGCNFQDGCPSDCTASTPGSYCGDGTCDNGETQGSCPSDCAVLAVEGGDCYTVDDHACDGDTQLYCHICTEADLLTHTYCKDNHAAGDGVWQFSQYCSTTNRECQNGFCQAICGDGICGTYESADDCPGYDDCAATTTPAFYCGDGNCDSDETCASCPVDCGSCTVCGDGNCDSDEDASSCPSDCGAPAVLIGHWKFDGNGGNEISGGSIASRIGASVILSTGGASGGYVHIPSSSDTVRIPYSSVFDLPDSFTVDFWFRQSPDSEIDGIQNLVHKGSGTNNYNFKIHRFPYNQYNNGAVITGFTSADTGYWKQTSNRIEPAHNAWHHVAFTKNTSGSAYYVDGTLIHSADYTDTAKTPASDIVIGDMAVDLDIDNLRIYDNALTADEITSYYNSVSPATSYCGDGNCDSDENLSLCPDDCAPAESVALHSIEMSGGNLNVSYSKNFATCVHLLDSSYNTLHTNNVFCTEGDNISSSNELSLFTVEVGQQVRLCHGNDYNLCSDYKTIAGSANYITVTSPAAGSQWVKGNTYDIVWQYGGWDASQYVHIDVCSGSGCYTLFSQSDEILVSSGSVSWAVGVEWPNPAPGDSWYIRVFLLPINWEEGVDYDKSDYFSIAESGGASILRNIKQFFQFFQRLLGL